MPNEPESLEVLVRVPTDTEAALVVQLLAEHGIPAEAVGQFSAGFRAEAPGDVSVLVARNDAAQARAVLAAESEDRLARRERARRSADGPIAFPCQECGKTISFPRASCGHVETCPLCGEYVDVPESS